MISLSINYQAQRIKDIFFLSYQYKKFFPFSLSDRFSNNKSQFQTYLFCILFNKLIYFNRSANIISSRVRASTHWAIVRTSTARTGTI